MQAMSALKGFRQQAAKELLCSPVLPTCDAPAFNLRCQAACGPPQLSCSDFGPRPRHGGHFLSSLTAALARAESAEHEPQPVSSIDEIFSNYRAQSNN